MSFDNFELIYSYTRKQTLEDGVLIDINQEAAESGFKIPVAITGNLYHRYIEPPADLEGEGQSTRGRLHDVLEMFKAAASVRWEGSYVFFDVIFLMKPRTIQTVKVLGVVGPDDNGKPCLTIMLPEDE